MPLVSWALELQHTGGVRHHILIMYEGLLNVCPSGSCVRVGDGVIQFVWTIKIIMKPEWPIQLSIG